MFTTGSGNTVTIEIQVGTAITGAPLDSNDAGIVSFDDTQFTVDANGFVQLIGGSMAIDSITGDDLVAVDPDAMGNIYFTGTIVANATNVKPLYIDGDAGTNTQNFELQLSTTLVGVPADSNDAGICSFDDAAFTITANGFVQLIGGGPPMVTNTGDDGVDVSPSGGGNFNWIGLTVANATHAKPVYFKDSATANALDLDVQVAAAITGAPGDKNDAGLSSFNDTQFTVDADGYVSFVGGANLPGIQTLTSDDPTTVGPDANGDIDITGEAVANATNAKPVFVDAGTNALNIEVQVGAAITGAPADKNDAGICSFDDTVFSVDANGYVSLAGGGLALTITTDDASVVNPVANNWNVIGLGETSTESSGDPNVQILSPRLNEFVVDPTLDNGTHQTIAAAIAAASSGDTVFIRPGTYTEDLTLPTGINLTGLSGQDRSGDVSIVGKISCTDAGSRIISNIKLITNSDYCLEVSGTASTAVQLSYCNISCTDNTGINQSSTGGSTVAFRYCTGNTDTTGITLFTKTSGTMEFRYCNFTNTGLSTTASTNSAGDLRARYTIFGNIYATSSTGNFSFYYVNFENQLIDSTCITSAGAATNTLYHSILNSGSAVALSVGAGTTVFLHKTTIESSNANQIDGAGTLNFSSLSRRSTSRLSITTTTATSNYSELGSYTAIGQPAFLASSALQTDVTGDGTVYTVTFTASEIFDQNSNFDGTSTFTAPVTGRYQMNVGISAQQMVGTTLTLALVTSNRTYTLVSNSALASSTAGGAFRGSFSVLADFDASDTATVQFTVTGGTKTVDIQATPPSFFSGYLAC